MKILFKKVRNGSCDVDLRVLYKVHFKQVNHEPVHVIHLIVYTYIGTPVSWNIP